MNKEEFIDSNMKLSKEDIIYNYYEVEEKLIEKLGIEHENYELKRQCKRQKEVIDKINHILNNQINYREFVDIVNAIEDVVKEVE